MSNFDRKSKKERRDTARTAAQKLAEQQAGKQIFEKYIEAALYHPETQTRILRGDYVKPEEVINISVEKDAIKKDIRKKIVDKAKEDGLAGEVPTHYGAAKEAGLISPTTVVVAQRNTSTALAARDARHRSGDKVVAKVPMFYLDEYQRDISTLILLGVPVDLMIRKLGEKWGLHTNVHTIRRLRDKMVGSVAAEESAARALSIIEKLDSVILNRDDFSQESTASLAHTTKIMVERSQLLQGKPTGITHSLIGLMVKQLNLNETPENTEEMRP